MATMATKTSLETSDSFISNMGIAKTIAKGGGFVLLGSFAGKGIKFATEIVLGRSLGPDGYGVYALGLSVLMILGHFSSLGLKTGVLRFAAGYFATREYSKFRGLLKFSLWSVIGAGIVVGLGVVFSGGYLANRIFNDGRLRTIFYLVGIGLPAYGAMWVVTEAIRGQKKLGLYTTLEHVGQPLLFLILVGVGLLFGLTSPVAFTAFIISSGIVAFVALIFLLYSSPFQNQRESSKNTSDYESSRWLSYSLPLIVVGVSYMLLHETDRVMIGHFLGTKSVGVYNAAARLAYLSEIFINSFAGIFSPLAAGFHHRGELERIRFLLVTTTRWTVILTLPVVGMLMMFPGFFLGWFGHEYKVAAFPLMFIAFAYLTSAGTGNTGTLLKMVDRQNVEVMNTIAAAVLNIVLNFLLIPVYGIMGAAIGTGVSIIFIQLVKLIEVKIFLGFTPYELNFLKPVFASLLSAAIALLMKRFMNVSNIKIAVLCILIFLLCYILLLVLFGIEKEEQSVLKHIWSVIKTYQPI